MKHSGEVLNEKSNNYIDDVFFALFVAIGFFIGVNYFNEDLITSNENLENSDVEFVSNEPRLSCFDFIDK